MDEKIEKTSQPLACVAGCGNKTCYRLNGMALCLPCMIFPTLETEAMIEASFAVKGIIPAGNVQTFNWEAGND